MNATGAKAGERQRTLLGPTWMAAWTMRVSTNSQASTIISRSAPLVISANAITA